VGSSGVFNGLRKSLLIARYTTAYCLSNSGCSVLLADGERYERLLPELAGLRQSGLKHEIVARSSKSFAGTVAWMDLVSKGVGMGKPLPRVELDPDDTATIF
jgi:hypothetical protein